MKRLFAVLLACCFLILPCPVLAAAPAPGLTVPLTPDPRTEHYKITVSDTETITASSVTRSVEHTGITAQTDVLVEYPLDVEHPGTYYVTVSALPEAGRIGLEASASKTVPVTTGCCPGVEGAFILGSGNAADPYQVYTPAQLAHVRQHLDAHFIQERDLTLTGIWTPLGVLTGVYDGGGHSISGLRATGGLFHSLNGATVKNVTLISPNIQGTNYVGGIAGVAGLSNLTNCTVTNGTIYGDTRTMREAVFVGGIIGYTDTSTVANCKVTGTVGGIVDSGMALYQGGITGHNIQSSYIGCLTSVVFPNAEGSGTYAGGIVGVTGGHASPITLQNCHWTNPAWALGNGSGTGSTPNTGDSFGNSQVASIEGLS